jgi:hypothetical protein
MDRRPIPEAEFAETLRFGRTIILGMAGGVIGVCALVAWLQVGGHLHADISRSGQSLRLVLDAVVVVLFVLSRNAGPWLITQPVDGLEPEELNEAAVNRLFVGSILAGALACVGPVVGLVIAAWLGHAVDAYVFGAVALVLLIMATPTRRGWSSWVQDFELVVKRA